MTQDAAKLIEQWKKEYSEGGELELPVPIVRPEAIGQKMTQEFLHMKIVCKGCGNELWSPDEKINIHHEGATTAINIPEFIKLLAIKLEKCSKCGRLLDLKPDWDKILIKKYGTW